MRSRSRLVWLGLTPEPERELPVAVATLRTHLARRSATNPDIARSGTATVNPDTAGYPDIVGAPDVVPWIKAEMSRIDDAADREALTRIVSDLRSKADRP